MTSAHPARTLRRTRLRRGRVAGALVAAAALIVAIGQLLPASSSSTGSTLANAFPPSPETRGATVTAAPPKPTAPPGPLGMDDGAVPEGTTAFDGAVPGVANLDPALLRALRAAAREAADDGLTLVVDSGWRSAAYQRRLLDEAVVTYGSEAEAARWDAPPERSLHVSGDAVDIGPSAAAAWLGEHGAAHGLCRIYDNEPWHFELRPGAAEEGCLQTYADPTNDPRLQR